MRLEILFDDTTRAVLTERIELPPPAVPLYMHREDRDIFGYIRSCAPCPAVFTLKDDPHVFIGRQMQYYLRAINYNMTVGNVYLLLDDHLGFANRLGYPSLSNPGLRQDWFFNRNTSEAYKPPQLDKVRTCSRSVLTGTEAFSLLQTFKDVANVAKMILGGNAPFLAAKTSFRQAVTASNNVLKVWAFDSTKLPPLKPGRSYPTDISKVNPDDYLYMPETDREKFLVANIVNARGEVVQFPRGGLYPWFEGGTTPASFLPHIYNPAYGDILYPLRNLVRVASVPSPYRNN